MYYKKSWFLSSLAVGLAGYAAGDTTAAGAISSQEIAKNGYYPGSQNQIQKHPQAPPSPQPDSIPAGSTLFNLDLEGRYWDVLIKDDATLSEVRFIDERTIGSYIRLSISAAQMIVRAPMNHCRSQYQQFVVFSFFLEVEGQKKAHTCSFVYFGC